MSMGVLVVAEDAPKFREQCSNDANADICDGM